MKKTVSLILTLLLVCTTLFSLTGCGEKVDVDTEIAKATAPLNDQIDRLNEEIVRLNAKISALDSEKEKFATDKKTLAEENAILKAEKSKLESDISELKVNITELESNVAKLETEVFRLKASLDGNTEELVGEIEKLEAEITALESEIEALNDEKIALYAKIAELGNKITEIEAIIDEQENQIATLDSTISLLTSEKETLIADKNALTNEIISLKEYNTVLKAENDTLKLENDVLKNEIEELESQNNAIRNCLADKHTYVNGVCSVCGKIENSNTPAYTRDDDYIYFGEYPQTIKADNVTITETIDHRGYYLGNDGCYYAKVIATPCESDYTFSTGASVEGGIVYYFKVEPIRWRILSEKNGEAFLLCDSIIANIAYQSNYYKDDGIYYTSANGAPSGTYASNYEYSEVREWLNSTFYENAFNSIQQTKILSTLVDNNAASTGDSSNSYVCNDTMDRIFILSYAEVTNEDYGFLSKNGNDIARYMITSDYSRAMGAKMTTESQYYGNGYWLMRSTFDNKTARYIDRVGIMNNSSLVYLAEPGVVPALKITL